MRRVAPVAFKRGRSMALSRMIPLPESRAVLSAPPASKARGAHRAPSVDPEPGDLV